MASDGKLAKQMKSIVFGVCLRLTVFSLWTDLATALSFPVRLHNWTIFSVVRLFGLFLFARKSCESKRSYQKEFESKRSNQNFESKSPNQNIRVKTNESKHANQNIQMQSFSFKVFVLKFVQRICSKQFGRGIVWAPEWKMLERDVRYSVMDSGWYRSIYWMISVNSVDIRVCIHSCSSMASLVGDYSQ